MHDFDDTTADLTLQGAISDRPRVDRAIAEAALAAALTPTIRAHLERETFVWAVRVPSFPTPPSPARPGRATTKPTRMHRSWSASALAVR